MLERTEVYVLLLLMLGAFLLTQSAKLPHWLTYCLMLAILVVFRRLAPQYFTERWSDTIWRVCIGAAVAGLLLETGSQLVG